MKIERSHLISGWIISFGNATLRVSRRGAIVGAILSALVLLASWALLMHGTLQFSTHTGANARAYEQLRR